MILASYCSRTVARPRAGLERPGIGTTTLAVASLSLLLMAAEGPFHAAAAGAITVDAADGVPDAGNCGGKTNACNTIQAGVDAAAVGGKIKIKKGLYTEAVVIGTADLSIKGKGKDGVIVDSEIPTEDPTCEADPGRTVYAGSVGSDEGPCGQFDGTAEATCEAAWATQSDADPFSCFWDAINSTCEECDSGAGSSGLCVNTCVACVDPSNTDFVGQGSPACRTHDGTDATTCEAAWAINNNGDAVSCWWDTDSSTCEGCGPTNEGNGQCDNTCRAGGAEPDAGLTITAPGVSIKKILVRNGKQHGIFVKRTAAGTVLDGVSVRGPSRDCLVIEADDVTLSKSSLIGCGDDAIDAGYYDEMTSTSITLNGLTIFGNYLARLDSGGIEADADNALIVSNTVQIAEDDDCIDVRGDDAIVRRNNLSTCDRNALVLSGDRFLVADNVGFATTDAAFNLSCESCASSFVIGNLARDVSDTNAGFDINGQTPGLVVEDNTAVRIPDNGFDLEGDGIILRGNVAAETGGPSDAAGFLITGSNHVLEGNLARGSNGDGFSIHGSGHELTGNDAVANLEDGFDVQPDAEGVVLTGNTATSNQGMGFEVSGGASMTTLEDNVASGNGIDLCDEGDATVASGNTAASTTLVCLIGD